MVLECFLEGTLGYSMKMEFLSYIPYLLSKITVLWHARCKIFTLGAFLQKRMDRINCEKSGMSENMFLKTYKKISRFVLQKILKRGVKMTHVLLTQVLTFARLLRFVASTAPIRTVYTWDKFLRVLLWYE